MEECQKCSNKNALKRQCFICGKTYCLNCTNQEKPANHQAFEQLPFWLCPDCAGSSNVEATSSGMFSQDSMAPLTGTGTGDGDPNLEQHLGANPEQNLEENPEENPDPNVEPNPQPQRTRCRSCRNLQPVYRICCVCESAHKYFCVGDDCWNMFPISEDGREIPVWICYYCLENKKEYTSTDKKYFLDAAQDEARQQIRAENLDYQQTLEEIKTLLFESLTASLNLEKNKEELESKDEASGIDLDKLAKLKLSDEKDSGEPAPCCSTSSDARTAEIEQIVELITRNMREASLQDAMMVVEQNFKGLKELWEYLVKKK